jgi:predicted DNA-binding helix-hairpin-helix protein
MPGAEYEQVRRAMCLANRVSINLEAPDAHRLERLAPQKIFMEELIKPLQWVDKIRSSEELENVHRTGWPSVTTQFVVGAAGESDLELLQTTELLNQQIHLNRAYYSAFSPVRDTPLENQPATSPVREHRLYQASFLLRDYGFTLEDLPFGINGDLPLQTDPKLAWAKVNLIEQGVEINTADREMLLRVPGIGPHSVRAILSARQKGKIRSLSDLKQLGVRTNQLSQFILLDGKKPEQQLSLWAFSRAE